ncbi:hypothetical protein D9Q98_005586 [Chlorella vulgaris]|uniref:RecA family profile 1 domain-containing protein n=1 Tax=Chlorella vulgaris TaxID=3077 RepID=A0A9D4TMI2_CHLVU|nr:hypothetical protein D9Q98_005586 [Chlorella vulgaris]
MPRVAGLSHEGVGGRLPRTVEAYLSTDVDALIDTQGGLLPEEDQALKALFEEVQLRHAPPMVTGTQLYADLNKCSLLETGCQGIDSELLRGGLRGGQLVEVCGESAAGKTQLCISAAAAAARAQRRVVYVDSSNALSGRRLAQVLLAQEHAAAQGQAPEAITAVQALPAALKFVEVRPCYDVHSLLAVLDELLAQAQQLAQREVLQQQHQQQQQQQQGQQQQQQQAEQQQQQQQQEQPQPTGQSGTVRKRLEELPVGLLVVDSLSALIAPVLGGRQHGQGHALLAAAASTLKAFAASSNAVVLATNHLVGGSDERRHEKRPAMGESWRNQAHVRLQLSRPGPGTSPCFEAHTATLTASSLLPAGLCVPFYLGEGGLSSLPLEADGRPHAMQH